MLFHMYLKLLSMFSRIPCDTIRDLRVQEPMQLYQLSLYKMDALNKFSENSIPRFFLLPVSQLCLVNEVLHLPASREVYSEYGSGKSTVFAGPLNLDSRCNNVKPLYSRGSLLLHFPFCLLCIFKGFASSFRLECRCCHYRFSNPKRSVISAIFQYSSRLSNLFLL